MSLDWMSTVIDWDTCKIQYEVMGDSLSKVAVSHNILYETLKHVAEEEGWTQGSPNPENIRAHLKDVIALHKSKLTLAALYRDMQLFPQLNELESELIDKVRNAIRQIDPTDMKSASALRALGQTLTTISDRKVINASVIDDEHYDDDINWSVEIVEAKRELHEVSKQLPQSANA